MNAPFMPWLWQQKGLFVKYGYAIPSDHTERFNFLEEISTKEVKIKNLKFKERLGKAFEILHVKTYYHGIYNEKEVKKRIKKRKNTERTSNN